MAHRSSGHNKHAAGQPALDLEEVLEALRGLIPRVSSPVVQECLRAARCEIAYLTSTDGTLEEHEDEDEGLKDVG